MTNKIYYYMMSESEDIIDFIFTEEDMIEALKGDDENYPIMIELEERSSSSDEKTKLISNKLKGKFLDEAIESYKHKC